MFEQELARDKDLTPHYFYETYMQLLKSEENFE